MKSSDIWSRFTGDESRVCITIQYNTGALSTGVIIGEERHACIVI